MGKARTNLPRKPLTPKTASKPPEAFGANGVFYSFPQGEGGPIEIKVDFAQAPVPLNYYYADSLRISIDKSQQMAILSFGRREESTSTFVDRIDVVMPIKTLGPFWVTSRHIEEAVDKVLQASGISAETGPMQDPKSLASTLFANMIFLSAGDGESTFDFYHMPARDVHLARTQKKNIDLLPVIRVVASSALTKEFFIRLRPHVENATKPASVAEGGKRAART